MRNKSVERSIILGLAIVASSPALARDDYGRLLGQCFERQAAMLPFSGVVLAGDGQARFERASGFVDSQSSRTASAGDPFRLASLQKILTAVAIGQLVDKGLVDLDAPVGQYVAGLPADMARATVDQLLQHRSGVASMTLLNPQIARTLAEAKQARDLLPLITASPLSFAPGTKQEYSNGGYFLLGVVIEQVSGKAYGDYLRDTVFTPLGMGSSGLIADQRTAIRLTRAAPGRPPLPEPRPLIGGPQFNGTPAGDGVSSANDLYKLGRALLGDGLLSSSVKQRLFPRKAGTWRIGQSGGSIGTNADFSVYPDSGWVIVVLSNYDPPAGELMGEVLRGVVSGKGCTPLGPADRPSPFRIMAPQGHASEANQARNSESNIILPST